MNHWTRRSTAHRCGQLAAWPRRRATIAAAAVVSTAMLAAGCGHQIYRAQPGQAQATAAQDLAVAANSGCVQATPLVERALGVLGQLQRGTVTAADARNVLTAELTGIERLARATPDDVLQQSLANAFDAFTAFRAVMFDRRAPAYPGTFSNLAGTLTGFQRTCSVANPDFATGTQGWAADNSTTALSRSASGHGGRWSLQVTNTGRSPAAAGFTDSPSWVPSTLKGSEQIGLWARALSGAATLTVQVREMSGSTVMGSQQVTMKLGPAFSFENLTYQIRRPGSRLSLRAWATGLPPGGAWLVDDITMVRELSRPCVTACLAV